MNTENPTQMNPMHACMHVRVVSYRHVRTTGATHVHANGHAITHVWDGIFINL